LSRESNVFQREQKARGQPVARANEELPFKVLQEAINFMVASGKLSNISKERHDKDIGSEDVVEKSSTKVLPSLYRVCSFFNGIVELTVS